MARNLLLSTFVLIGFQTIGLGQSVSLTQGSGSGTPGGTVSLPINLTSAGGAQTAGLQWSFSFSSDVTGVTVVAGSSTTAAGKSLTCNGNSCVVFGFNSTVLTDGPVAVATFQIAANPASNPIPIQLTSIVGTTAAGTSVLSSGVAGSITLPVTVSLGSLSCTASSISTPGSTPCSVTLNTAAGAGGFAVGLSSNNANLSVPSSITVAAGQTSGSFTANGAQVSANQSGIITATAGSASLTKTLSLVAPAQLSSLACAPSTLGSNASGTCTVTLNNAASSAATVTLTSNNGLLTVPGSVVVASGQSSATFAAASGTIGSSQNATLTATLSGVSTQTTISLAAAAQISSLNCSPATVNAPGASTCTVTLTAVTAGTIAVTLSSNNTSVTLPASVNISAGLSSAPFTATVATVTSNQTAVLTSTLNGSSQTFTLTASAPAQLTSLACAPSTLGSNASSTCTATLNKTAPSAATVSLASNSGLLTVPASVVVAAGQSSATFTATSGTVSANQNATVTATLSGVTQQAVISLAAATQLSSLNCAPGTVSSPGTSTCTVTLTATSASAVSITLLSNNTSVTVPGSVNIGAGLSSATFTATVAAVVSNQTALLTASLNSVSRTFTLTATGNTPAQLTSLACTPAALGSNASTTCTVTLNSATTSLATVALTSDSGLLSVPASVAVLSGQSSATFAAATGTVSSNQNATVTATLSGANRQAILNLNAAVQISSLACAPATVVGPGPSTCTVTLNGATSSALNAALSSNSTSVSVPPSVTIGAGLRSATFTANAAPVASNQSALLTVTLNGSSQSFTISDNANAGVGPQITSLTCTPSAMASKLSAACTVHLSAPPPGPAVVSLASNNGLLSVPPSVTIPSGQSSAAFSANSGSVSSSQSVTVTATMKGQSRSASISLAPSVNCDEFQTSPGGLCMIQDVLPWVTFGGGWESRLNVGNLSKSSGGGTIQFSFTLLPAVPASGGIQNHMPAFYTVNNSKQLQIAETGTYSLSPGTSILLDFLSPPAGCDAHGQNCGSSQDLQTTDYGAVLIQYVSDNPAYLRGIAKAQLTMLANSSTGAYGWQTTEHEMPASNLWTAPVAVSANQTAKPQTSQQASAALANPGAAPITVRGTLYDGSGRTVTFRDFQLAPLGTVAMVFSQDPSQPFGGFGNAMFPGGADFNGLVTFQVISPTAGAVAAMVLQYVGSSMSSVEVNSPSSSPSGASGVTSLTRCAEFPMAADGSCIAQYTLPWVVFGAGWESRLKVANPPSATGGTVQVRFNLLPAISNTDGTQNHMPAFFSDSRTAPLQMAESASYALSAGQSVDVRFLYPPAACDIHGQNCAGQPDPNAFSSGSVLVQYSSIDPATLRRLADPQLAFLMGANGQSYSSQITEQGAPAATTWTAPVAMSANQNADPLNNLAASAAIANPGNTPVTVRGTLLDQNGNLVTYNDFVIPASGALGIVFAWDPAQPFGGFGSAAFPQGQDFNGWVTFNVTSPASSGVNVVVLQYVGDTMSSVNVQSLP